MGIQTRDWSAWYNAMPGPGEPDPRLHVTGRCDLPSSAARVRLEPVGAMELGAAGLQVLALIVEMPGIGDTSMATRQVTWEGDPGTDVTHVKILIEHGDDIDLNVVDAV